MDVRQAKEAYARGENVTDWLKRERGLSRNDPEIIEIAYDLQAGTYVSSALEDAAYMESYAGQAAAILSPFLKEGDVFLDVGTGECTTLAHLEKRMPQSLGRVIACDISWSRLHHGRSYLESLGCRPVGLFTADLMSLPLLPKSVDVVWTSHALEPNGGREIEAVSEILRVARSCAVLFEPSYENNSEEGRARMELLGYVKGLPDAIEAAGGELIDCVRIEGPRNPLNPTYAYVIRPPEGSGRNADGWACPVAGTALREIDGFLYSDQAGLAYPVLMGIPVLRRNAGVLATALARAPEETA